MTERWTAEAPGKLLLFGEHAAVYGYPAVGISLDRTLTVGVAPAAEWRFCFGDDAPCEEFSGEYQDFFPHLEEIARRAGRAARCTTMRGHVSISSDLPIAAGFGSSAALCAALARLLLAEGARPEDVWIVAHRLESFFHGTASGIDTGLSVLGGSRVFWFGPDRELPEADPLTLPRATIVYGALPRRRSTRELVAAVRRRLETDPVGTRDVLDRLGGIAREVATGASGDAHQLGALATAAHELLRELHVSSQSMDRLISAGLAAGALGGKLSGAGGGGAYFFVCDNPESGQRVAAALHESYDAAGSAGTGGAAPSILRI